MNVLSPAGISPFCKRYERKRYESVQQLAVLFTQVVLQFRGRDMFSMPRPSYRSVKNEITEDAKTFLRT